MARFRISIVELDDTGNPPSKDAQKWHVLVIYAEESSAEAIQSPPAVVTGRARRARFVPARVASYRSNVVIGRLREVVRTGATPDELKLDHSIKAAQGRNGGVPRSVNTGPRAGTPVVMNAVRRTQI